LRRRFAALDKATRSTVVVAACGWTFVAVVMIGIVLAGRHPRVDSTPEVSKIDDSPNEFTTPKIPFAHIPVPPMGTTPPGSEVELTGPTPPNVMGHWLCVREADQEELMRRQPVDPEFEPYGDCFKKGWGEPAMVLVEKPDRLQVMALTKPWKGRTGWIARGWVRPRPTTEELTTDIVEGLTLGERRYIFSTFDTMRSGDANAMIDANMPHLLYGKPSPPDGQLQKLAKDLEKETDRRVAAHFRITEAHLERIFWEGNSKRWPGEIRK
jgi:hypothetical protein